MGKLKNLFIMGRTGRLLLGAVGLVVGCVDVYLAALGWTTTFYVLGAGMFAILVVMIVNIAVEEDQVARSLWPELYAQQDASKVIARAKRSSRLPE